MVVSGQERSSFHQSVKKGRIILSNGDHTRTTSVFGACPITAQESSHIQTLPRKIVEIEEEEPKDLRQGRSLPSASHELRPLQCIRVTLSRKSAGTKETGTGCAEVSFPVRSDLSEIFSVEIDAFERLPSEDREPTRQAWRLYQKEGLHLETAGFLHSHLPNMPVDLQME